MKSRQKREARDRGIVQRKKARSTAVQQKAGPAGSPVSPSLLLAAHEGDAVQLQGGGATADVHAAARQGTAGPGGSLPHLDTIQKSFGHHDVSSVQAHTDGAAAAATQAMGARAFASGGHVAFGAGQADLHTAAHEAAHVVQQRGGVSLAGGVGQAGDRYERHADAVADVVVAGGSAQGLLDQMAGGRTAPGTDMVQGAPVQRDLAADGEEGVGGDDIRVIILNLALAPVMPGFVASINAAGLAVSAACAGLRGSGMAVAGVGIGGGVDQVWYIDIASWQVSPDVVAFGEIGIGAEAGAGFGVIAGFRVSPHGEYGDPSESYAGPAINASVEALAGVGFSVSPSVLTGGEGWISACFSLGEQFGASLSVSYGVSAQQVTQALRQVFDQATSGLRRAIELLSEVGEAIDSAVQSLFESMFGIFFPDNWDLSGYTAEEQAVMRRFGHYMNEVIAGQGGIDAFLRTESADPPPSISDRINEHSTWDLVLMIQVMHALNARYQRNEGGTEDEVGVIWEATDFNDTSYLNFLTFLSDNNLLG